MAVVLFTGNPFALWVAAMVAMGITFITNLAALPTKVTIPAFFRSLVADMVIIGIAIAQGFNVAGTYL